MHYFSNCTTTDVKHKQESTPLFKCDYIVEGAVENADFSQEISPKLLLYNCQVEVNTIRNNSVDPWFFY